MMQTFNRTDKHPRLSIHARRHIILIAWIATLLSGLVASCGDESTTHDAATPYLPVGDASTQPDVAQPTVNQDSRVGPTTNDAAQNTGNNDAATIDPGIADAARDRNSNEPDDAGSLLDAVSPLEDATLNDATGADADSASPPADAGADVDQCPDDPNKTEPGICGCGNEELSDPDATAIDCIKSHLLHRYRFDGTGTTATDSVGSANGTIHGNNANLGGGSLALGGDLGAGYSNEGYVDLPSSIWDGLTNATFEAWVTWNGQGDTGSAAWQRIFDFGDQNGLEGNSYLFLTPQGGDSSYVLVGFTTDRDRADGDNNVSASAALPQGVEKHVAVLVDAEASVICLYIDGEFERSGPMQGTLAEVSAVNLWLGRSNYTADSEFYGEFNEFRIWDVAMNDDQMRASFNSGPDYEFVP